VVGYSCGRGRFSRSSRPYSSSSSSGSGSDNTVECNANIGKTGTARSQK